MLEHSQKGKTPLPYEEQVFTKNAPSASPERQASNRVQLLHFEAPTNSKSSPRASDHQDHVGAVKHQK